MLGYGTRTARIHTLIKLFQSVAQLIRCHFVTGCDARTERSDEPPGCKRSAAVTFFERVVMRL